MRICDIHIKCAALGLALSLVFSDKELAAFAASSSGTASATVVASTDVGDDLKTGEFKIRLPGLTGMSESTDMETLSTYVQASPATAAQKQCVSSKPCCNPSSEGRLHGNPASSVVLTPVRLGSGIQCRLTVMYN